MPLTSQHLWGERGGRPTGPIQAVEPRAIPHQRQRVTADAVRGWLDDGERNPCRQRRIHRIATLPKDGQTGLRGQRLAGGDDAMRREDWLAFAGMGECVEVEREAD
jgi:hypothetical protein